MVENWIKWNPIENLSPKYYVDSISDTKEEFNIILSESSNEKSKILISFGSSVDAYRSTYESFRQKIIYDLDQKYGTIFFAEWTFFKVTDSLYLRWISEQSYGITNSLSLIHFSFLAVDSVVDVVASRDPKVRVL